MRIPQGVLMAAVVSAWALVPARASADVLIDFNGLAGSLGASYTESGVTFSAVGGGSLAAAQGPNGTIGLLETNAPRKELRADIAGGATSVSVDLGDFGQDSDLVFLEVFDASDNSLGFTSQLLASTFTGMITLSLSAPNIAYAVMGARPPAGDGNSVYHDNFRFEPVPEPSALVLTAVGALGLAAASRRRRPATR